MALALILAAPAGTAAQTGGPSRVDSLLDRGRYQEAAWALLEAGDTARAEEVLDRLRTVLRRAPEDARPLGMDSQGVSFTWRLDHGDGVESIFKVDGSDIFCPQCNSDREVATYRLDRLFGFDLTPMTVHTRFVEPQGDTLYGSTMYFVRGARTPEAAGVEKPDRLHLFDAILGNSDRHDENWLVVGDRIVAIDHNRSFEYQPTTRPRTCWEQQVDSMDVDADLGRPWDRYRSMPPESIRSALEGLDTTLARRFLAMRDRVIDRVERHQAEPEADIEHEDCLFP